MQIEKFSIGIGDRFGQEGLAQLRALQKAEQNGALVVPVWNKSFREHSLIGTKPDDVREEADAAVKALGWDHSYYVDAVLPPRPVQLVWKNSPRGRSARS